MDDHNQYVQHVNSDQFDRYVEIDRFFINFIKIIDFFYNIPIKIDEKMINFDVPIKLTQIDMLGKFDLVIYRYDDYGTPALEWANCEPGGTCESALCRPRWQVSGVVAHFSGNRGPLFLGYFGSDTFSLCKACLRHFFHSI